MATLMDQLIALEGKVMALLDMEDLDHHLFDLKIKDNYNQHKEIYCEN